MEKFQELGRAAHDAGKMRSPALDKLVMQELEDMPVGTGAVEILTAWTEGWDAAHKEHTERMDELRYELFTVVGAAEYDAATDTLTPFEEPNRWESAGKFHNVPVPVPPYGTYRDTL